MEFRAEEPKHSADPKIEKRRGVVSNMKSILIYALSMAVALGFNSLILTVFNSFPDSNHIMGKTTYVVIMFGITIALGYFLGLSSE